MANNYYSSEYDQQQKAKIIDKLALQQQAFNNMPYSCQKTRINDLKKLKMAILQFQTPLLQALSEDFGHRSCHDSKMGDILPTISSINYAIKKTKTWMRPCKRHVSPLFKPSKAFVMYQPLGVVGIICPWNYPVFLAIGPLTTALAAGNRAMIKMSEFTPKTNIIIEQMLKSIFDTDKVAVITGGSAVASYFSEQCFDHLLFTGSTEIGKKVMQAAAKNLTPVTLELGGKSPVIIDNDMNIDDAVSRFLLGKCINAGQTCVAPDYILCPTSKIEALQQALATQFTKMYPTVSDNDDYGAIINQAHLQRLTAGLVDAQDKGAIVTTLSIETLQHCLSKGKLPLTIVTKVTDDMSIMNEEIFGPILPIVAYQDIDEAITYVNQRPRPLALYLCSYNKALQQKILETTHSGGVCFNDAAIHVAQDDLPFGGIGPSGMGQYHGHEGFLTFSNAKSVFKKGKINTTLLALPPSGKLIHKLIYSLFIR